MLTPDTKRHIDAARQVLVGKVPDPKSQIDQITNALVYKFMDDMDEQAAALGGKRRYFIGDYEKYGWRRLMNESLGAHERLNLYREALEGMSKNANLPELFQSIFHHAYLPFNDARTLSLFLKEINHFKYDNSEDLGNGYEYLLSIMGSQGDAGQFRTPRHVINFIVDAVNPTKSDSVFDPACGTAGFLISAYKHVMAKHDGKNDETGQHDSSEKPLTADEKRKIYKSYHGFDIDDNMVKMAKVNMYLHSFPDPNIIVHDSLSQENLWKERYDVILANPPFMTPKGGIQPHKRFNIQANRAEVLFVDYIASHINPVVGRAGVIVPEGIIFQSGKAYKELRKDLIESSLYAVISLPAGVFQPYSGVKTSILLLDKELAKTRDEILFVKIENDGYSLGAQRREVTGDQFPEALEVIERFKKGEELQTEFAHAVKQSEIAEGGDYNLSGERYRVVAIRGDQVYPTVGIQDVADVRKGSAITKKDINSVGKIPVVAGGQQPAYYHDVSNRVSGAITISASGAYAGFVNFWQTPIFASDCSTVETKDNSVAKQSYLYSMLKHLQDDIYKLQSGGGQPHIYPKDIQKIKIPLPPIEIQREIVAELDGYQRIIDAAQTIVKTYKPTIKINPEWTTSQLGDILAQKPMYGSGASKIDFDGKTRYVRITDITDEGELKSTGAVSPSSVESKYFMQKDDLLIARSGSVGRTYLHTKNEIDYQWAGYLINFRIDTNTALPEFVCFITKSTLWWSWIARYSRIGTLTNINAQEYSSFNVPLPPLEEQKQIAAELEAEQKLIDANKKLIETFQAKIKSKIAEVWGE